MKQELKNTDIKKFLFAGNATLTIESSATGKHYTYKVKKHKEADIYFVSLLNGPSNESDYAYVGIIKNDKKVFTLTAKSRYTKDATSVKAFTYFFNLVKGNKSLNKLKVYHSGSCGRCGRKLTTPESIKRGLGPFCAKQ